MQAASIAGRGGNLARTALMAGLLLAALGSATPAQAQQAEAQQASDQTAGDDEDNSGAEERMLELNEQGFAAFAEGNFEQAARKFEQAHTHLPDPNLRKNAAIAWFKAGNCDKASRQAVFFLLADEMTVKDRIEARSVLGHCRLEEAEGELEAGRAEQAGQIADYVAVLETDERVDERLSALEERLGRPERAPTPPEAPRARTEWAIVGVGVAILAGNALYHALSAQREDTLDALRSGGTSSVRQRQLRDEIDTAEWLVPTLYAAGAVTTGGGLWLAMTADTKKPASAPQSGQRAPASSFLVGWQTDF